MKKSLNKVLLGLATVIAAGSIGNAQNLDYTFVTVGCNRIDPIDIVAAGQGSTYDTISSANVGALNRLFTEVMALSPQPTFLLMTGDIVMGYRADTMYLAKQLQGWKALYNAHPISKSSIKVVVIPGNHETQDKAAGKKSTLGLERTFLREMKSFINGNNGPIATSKVAGTDSLMTDQSQLTYSFNYKNDHFLILNTDPTGRDSRLPFRWLRNDLKAVPNARHVFAFGHKPAYSSKFKPLDGLEAFVAQRDSFWTVLENAHAEAMFAAHEHVWDTIQGHIGKTWQVIAGNGGSAVESTWKTAPNNYHGFTLVSVYTTGKIVCQSMGHDIGTNYFDAVPQNPTTERANFRLETGVVIDHTPMLSTHSIDPFTLTATITDNISVKADTLMFWVNGVKNKTVAVVSGSTYTYTIPAQTGTGGIEYSFKATDSFGQVTMLPSEPNSRYSFRFGVPAAEGLSSTQTAYVTPVANGVLTKPILTVGDAVNNYKMVGIPDGLGAYDNGNGTFTVLMNHELGNTAGVVR
ncbi:MAG: metallophosphoesterase, partial [Opitutaceae bacterium]|nr:metallophosphoesterase [Cytophagales bacterium]